MFSAKITVPFYSVLKCPSKNSKSVFLNTRSKHQNIFTRHTTLCRTFSGNLYRHTGKTTFKSNSSIALSLTVHHTFSNGLFSSILSDYAIFVVCNYVWRLQPASAACCPHAHRGPGARVYIEDRFTVSSCPLLSDGSLSSSVRRCARATIVELLWENGEGAAS